MATTSAWLAERVDETIRPEDVAAIEACAEFLLLTRATGRWQIAATVWHWATGHGPRA